MNENVIHDGDGEVHHENENAIHDDGAWEEEVVGVDGHASANVSEVRDQDRRVEEKEEEGDHVNENDVHEEVQSHASHCCYYVHAHGENQNEDDHVFPFHVRDCAKSHRVDANFYHDDRYCGSFHAFLRAACAFYCAFP